MMKKIICLVLVILVVIGMFAGCNRQVIDFTYSYEYGIIKLPNGEVVEGRISSWRDYEGDSLQIVINGTTYYTHSQNVAMISY